ncbi:MAG: polyprenyl synthetase family protein [Oscillospiraceae bacterium]|nr:polyprenyl synthetase family protein [Oscillospiraceae bacterium]
MHPKNNDILRNYVITTENAIDNIFSSSIAPKTSVSEAMKYSLDAGGKRIRPSLVMEFCRVISGDYKKSINAAVAIEMIHTFSLIHDDLPCMDDDDFRRGKPSCHKKFGEAIALLAGDALENLAFRVIISSDYDDKTKSCLISEISDATAKMIDGQVRDLSFLERTDISEDDLLEMYSLKTCALIECSAVMGCICGGADKNELMLAREYAHNLGLAFQIRDDILDVIGDEKELGKPIGSDADNNKTTIVSVLGIEKASELAKKYSDNALNKLDSFKNNDFLKDLTKLLLERYK